MAEVNVRGVILELRTCKLTRAMLKQFRVLTGQQIPTDWWEGEGREKQIKSKYLVGYFHGSVLGDELSRHTLLTNNEGDYFVWKHLPSDVSKRVKQIYIG